MSNRKSNMVERKWRCVETEPPAFDLPVIVYQPDWKGQPVTLAAYACRDSSGHKFCFDIQSPELHRHDHRYSVTHWMPLPAPPNNRDEARRTKTYENR